MKTASRTSISGGRVGTCLIIAGLAVTTGAFALAPSGGNESRPAHAPSNPTSQTLFSDVTASAGISFIHTGMALADQMAGTGAAWFDFDRDGDLDLYVTRRIGGNAFYVNNGAGSFTDMATDYAIRDAAHDGAGVSAADFNNDGWPDLYLANADEDVLFKNVAGTSFQNITAAAGLSVVGSARGTTASWGDYDADGYLDLYLAHHSELGSMQRSTSAGAASLASRDRLLLNNGDETFTDVTYLFDPADLEGYGFIAAWTDYDDDGDLDILVVNDCPFGPQGTKLFRNDGGTDPLAWNFTEVSAQLGAGHCESGMGAAVGDYNRDGRLDYYYTNTGTPVLLLNSDDGFINAIWEAGIHDMTVEQTGRPRWSWGANFLDFDLDGWLDLYVCAGSMRGLPASDPQPNVLYRNNGDGKTFTDVSPACGADDNDRGRTSAMADYDNDGDLDLFVVNYEAEAKLFRNDNTSGHHYLIVELEGVESNRDGIGARVRVLTADGAYQYAETRSGSSLGAGDAASAHFGLGAHTTVEELRIRWPSGITQVLHDVPADQRIRVLEERNAPATDVESFIATASGRVVSLQWTTSSELNNASFEVLHVVDGEPHTVATLDGNGTSFRPQWYQSVITEVVGTHTFELWQTDTGGVERVAAETMVEVTVEVPPPSLSQLASAVPNPFNPATDLVLTVDRDQRVRVEVFDVRGHRVGQLFEGNVVTGVPTTIHFDGTGQPNGIYFIRARGQFFSASRKVLLVQ